MYGLEGILGNLVTSVATPAVGGIFGDMAGEALKDVTQDQLLKEITQTTVGALSGAAVGAGLGALTGGKSGALSGALTGGVGGGLGGYNAPEISKMFGMEQSVGAPQAGQAQPSITDQLWQQNLMQRTQSPIEKASVGAVSPGAVGLGSADQASMFNTTAAQPVNQPISVPSQAPVTQPSGAKGYIDFLKKNYEPLAGGFFLGSAYGANQDTEEQARQRQQQNALMDLINQRNARGFARSIYGYADGGYVERPSDALIKQLLATGPSMYGSQQHNLEKRPLNVQNLINSGAMRITYPGDGTGSYDPNLEGYSIVSRINDVGDPMTRGWPDKPDAYKDAARSLSDPRMLNQLSDAKYKQLIDSAAAAGLTEKDIYSGYADGGPVTVGLANPEIDVHFPAWAQEKIQREGGLAALQPGMKQGLATGGYINLNPEPQHGYYPMSQIASARPYPAATPQRQEVVFDNGYARGGLIDGPGDGMSDDIDANISGHEPVKVADGEYIIPKEIAAKYGPEKLKAAMTKIRAAAHAKKGKQIQQDAGKKALISALSGVKA